MHVLILLSLLHFLSMESNLVGSEKETLNNCFYDRKKGTFMFD